MKKSQSKKAGQKGIGSPLGHRGMSGAYGKPNQMKEPPKPKTMRKQGRKR